MRIVVGHLRCGTRCAVLWLQMPDIPAGAKFRTLTRRHQGGLAADDAGSRRGGRSRAADEMTTLTTSGTSDMDRWLERVFDQALDGTVDDLDDERTLSGRLKGGGDKTNQPSKVLRSPTCAQKRFCTDSNEKYPCAVLHVFYYWRAASTVPPNSDALPFILPRFECVWSGIASVISLTFIASTVAPFSSNRQHLSYDGWLEVRGEIIRTVLCCIVYWNCTQS